jgi:hypothetical protein
MIDATQAASQIPSSAYVIIGTLIVANVGTVVSVLYGIGRVIWFIAKLESRVAALEEKSNKDINAAHAAIRDIRKEIQATQ